MHTKIFLFLDYDGTLTPIVKKPHLAKLSSSRKAFLKKLSRDKDIKIAIVSGRKLKDIKSKLKIPGIHYIGNHGFEIDNWVHPKARSAKESILKILTDLKKKLKGIKGIIIEDKTYTASIHYRLVSTVLHGRNMQSDLDRLFEIFNELIKPYLRRKKVRVTYGKKVFEIRPAVFWDKGEAVKKLLKKNYFPIYIGDDVTDEDAFKVLRRRGLTICVGENKKTKAELRLSSVDAVYRFLQSLFNNKFPHQ